MAIHIPKVFTPSVPPDHDNYSFMGKAWKDRHNDVTEVSAKIGSGNKDLSEFRERYAHQQKLLEARLNTYLDTVATPVAKTSTTIGNVQVPYVKSPLPAALDMRVLPSFSGARSASMRSFNESKAASKITGDYLRCDPQVRQNFLGTLEKAMADAVNRPEIMARLKELHAELNNLNSRKEKHQDLDALADRKKELEEKKGEVGKKQGKDRLLGRAGLLLSGTDRELRSIERKTHEILAPSSYEMHRVANNGAKVSNRPLHVEELKQRRLGKSLSDTDLRTGIQIRNFTEKQFDVLADSIRKFQAGVRNSPGMPLNEMDVQALRSAVKPILYSADRTAVHRFIRDMVRQLKRAGVDPAELERINALIPDKPSGAQKLVQGLVPGTGKQMRLQDEAERMSKALPMVLQLAARHGPQLKDNLMQFDLSGVKALRDVLQGRSDQQWRALEFIKTPQGKAFVDALVKEANGMPIMGGSFLKRLGEPEVRKDAWKTLDLIKQMAEHTQDPAKFARTMTHSPLESNLKPLASEKILASMMTTLVNNNQHLFMMTSDAEFWEREAVDKVATRLTRDGDVNATQKSRIFKQMKMRAAAMGMEDSEVQAFMTQGIANTLRSRNMTIEGTKIAGVVESVTGNIMSTPISAAGAPSLPALALPGLVDSVLMPAGWALGQIPGAAIGATVLDRMKNNRLQEASGNMNPVTPDLDGRWAAPTAGTTYVSASKKLKLGGRIGVKKANVEKPALTPLFRTGPSQYGHAHVQVWKGMGQEISSMVAKPLRFLAQTAAQDIWKDLVIHNDSPLFGKAATENTATPSTESRRTSPASGSLDTGSARTTSVRSYSAPGSSRASQ